MTVVLRLDMRTERVLQSRSFPFLGISISLSHRRGAEAVLGFSQRSPRLCGEFPASPNCSTQGRKGEAHETFPIAPARCVHAGLLRWIGRRIRPCQEPAPEEALLFR